MKHNISRIMLLLSIFGIFATALIGRAEDGKKPTKISKKKSTDVSFDEVLVEGKYHFADEAVTTVEGDKVVDALLNVRTDFKDRIKKSSSRH